MRKMCGEVSGTYKEAETEDTNEAELLSPAEVEATERRERQDENDDVGDNVSCRVDVPERKIGDTRAWRFGQPELVDGRACKDDDEELGDGPEGDKNKRDLDGNPHLACPQDAVVLEEEGEFGGRQ
jgi:hypothetical protein